MTEHNKHKRPKRAPASVDGMLTDGRRLGLPASKSDQQRGSLTANLNNRMRRPDGFHAAGQASKSVNASSAENDEALALLNEPIVLDDEGSEAGGKDHLGPEHSRLRKIIKRSVLTLILLLVISGAYFGIKLYDTERNVFHGGGSSAALAADVDVNQLKGEGAGRVNVLLLGIDGPGFDGADLTDSMLLASIDPVNHKAVLLSIPRDLWVKIPGYWQQKINAAYAYGKEYSSAKSLDAQEEDGFNELDKTLEPILGITINYHVLLDFHAFQQAVNALGGITIDVPTEVYDPTIANSNHGNPVIALPGVQTMDGDQALLYARSRETTSDFARAQRQRALLVAIKQKAFSLGTFSNPVKVSDLLSSLGNNVFTDLTLNDTSRLYQILSQISSSQVTSIDMVTPPNDLITTGTMDNLSVDKPIAGLYDYSAIQLYVRKSLPDGFITKENAKVAIYNATDTTGLSATEATTLKSYSYNVTTAASSPNLTSPPTTTVVDLTNGADKYTRHYLEQRFGVTAVSKVPTVYGITPPPGTGFVIILGEDAAAAAK